MRFFTTWVGIDTWFERNHFTYISCSQQKLCQIRHPHPISCLLKVELQINISSSPSPQWPSHFWAVKMPSRLPVIVVNPQHKEFHKIKIETLKKENEKLKKMVHTLKHMKIEPKEDHEYTVEELATPICYSPRPPKRQRLYLWRLIHPSSYKKR